MKRVRLPGSWRWRRGKCVMIVSMFTTLHMGYVSALMICATKNIAISITSVP